jgi:hypothetical protein
MTECNLFKLLDLDPSNEEDMQKFDADAII